MTIPEGGDTPENSENVKSSHQFLARFHRLRRIHSTEDFFPPLTIHCCEFAHEPVARFPFCVFAGANTQREQHGDDPNGNVGRGNEKHKRRRTVRVTFPLHNKVQAARGERGRPRPPFRRPRRKASQRVSREARDTAGEAPALPSNSSRTRKLTFLRRSGHFRHACPHRDASSLRALVFASPVRT